MHPVLYQGATGSLNTYGLFILLAFVAAFVVTLHRSFAAGIHFIKLVPALGAAVVGGMLGGRLLYIVAVEPGLFGILSNPVRDA